MGALWVGWLSSWLGGGWCMMDELAGCWVNWLGGT